MHSTYLFNLELTFLLVFSGDCCFTCIVYYSCEIQIYFSTNISDTHLLFLHYDGYHVYFPFLTPVEIYFLVLLLIFTHLSCPEMAQHFARVISPLKLCFLYCLFHFSVGSRVCNLFIYSSTHLLIFGCSHRQSLGGVKLDRNRRHSN